MATPLKGLTLTPRGDWLYSYGRFKTQ